MRGTFIFFVTLFLFAWKNNYFTNHFYVDSLVNWTKILLSLVQQIGTVIRLTLSHNNKIMEWLEILWNLYGGMHNFRAWEPSNIVAAHLIGAISKWIVKSAELLLPGCNLPFYRVLWDWRGRLWGEKTNKPEEEYGGWRRTRGENTR